MGQLGPQVHHRDGGKRQSSHMLMRVAEAQANVLQEMERRELCYSRKLDKYRKWCMLWLEK